MLLDMAAQKVVWFEIHSKFTLHYSELYCYVQFFIYQLKIKITEAGKTAQELRALAALPVVKNLVPITHLGWVSTIFNSSFRNSVALILIYRHPNIWSIDLFRHIYIYAPE